MLTVHCSNRFEVLADRVADRVANRVGMYAANPFTPDHLVVPSAAIQRALRLHLANTHGISANLNFAFLAQWLWARVAAVVPQV